MSHTFLVKFRAFKREFLQNHSVHQAQIFGDSWNCYALSIFRHFSLLASSGNDEHMLKRQKNVNKDSPIKVMFILRKPVPGRRVTLPAESILANYYMRKKLTHLPERTALADALHDYGPLKATTTTTAVKTSLKKWISVLSKLIYLDPLNMSNAGDFSWSSISKDFIEVQKEEGKFVVVCPRPP